MRVLLNRLRLHRDGRVAGWTEGYAFDAGQVAYALPHVVGATLALWGMNGEAVLPVSRLDPSSLRLCGSTLKFRLPPEGAQLERSLRAPDGEHRATDRFMGFVHLEFL